MLVVLLPSKPLITNGIAGGLFYLSPEGRGELLQRENFSPLSTSGGEGEEMHQALTPVSSMIGSNSSQRALAVELHASQSRISASAAGAA
ncbi:MAG: hypothetical protein QOJ84_5718 [Bradyrhizobium sp.]|nr:hypothetical protein [Bradyrhizobium sp.]